MSGTAEVRWTHPFISAPQLLLCCVLFLDCQEAQVTLCTETCIANSKILCGSIDIFWPELVRMDSNILWCTTCHADLFRGICRAKTTELSDNETEEKLLVFRPMWVQNDIRSEMENLYQPTEPVWPQCSRTWEAHCWQWVSLLTGCHGNLARDKDHLCVRLVRACSATQAALICCVKLTQRSPG